VLKKLASLMRSHTSTPPTASEVIAARAVLHGTDPRLNLLAQQLEQAVQVVREYPRPDEFRVRPAWTYDNLTFPLEVDRIVSKELVLSDKGSGRQLGFRAVVGRSGFLYGLEGRTLDGEPWPREWDVLATAIDEQVDPLIILPSLEEQSAFTAMAREQLKSWVGCEPPARFALFPPATVAAIASVQERIGSVFSEGFTKFLSVTDGIEGPDLRLFGHRDVYELDEVLQAPIAVGWDSDDVDDFVVAISRFHGDDKVYRIDIHDRGAIPQVIAPGFREYLRDAFDNRRIGLNSPPPE
jgi:hypothetical protein